MGERSDDHGRHGRRVELRRDPHIVPLRRHDRVSGSGRVQLPRGAAATGGAATQWQQVLVAQSAVSLVAAGGE
jgi:hypothetical protein